MAPAASGAELSADPAVWDAALDRWRATGIDDYRYTIERAGGGPDWEGRYVVTVGGGEVVRVEALDEPEPLRSYRGQTFAEIVSMMHETGIDHGTTFAEGSFDPETGRPIEYVVRWGPTDDVGMQGRITAFEALDVPPPPRGDVNLGLSVTNQSYDDPEVAITVLIDGDRIVETLLPVGGQHYWRNYPIWLPPGDHELVAATDSGAERREVLSVPPEGVLYVHLACWGAAPDARLDFHVRGEPFLIA